MQVVLNAILAVHMAQMCTHVDTERVNLASSTVWHTVWG
jgi:hypothetical protein